MLLVQKHISVSCFARRQVLHHLVRLIQRSLLDPRLDLPLSRDFQHVADLVRASNTASAYFDPVAEQGERVDRWEVSTIWCADLNELKGKVC